MLAMAAVGTILALNTWKLRESRHPKPLPALSGPENYPAAGLPGLGYLPAETNVVAGIHVAEIRRDKTAAALLEPPLPGLLAQAASLVETRTGIKLNAVEHLVLGTTLKDDIPQLTAVVETVEPYNVDLLSRLYKQKATPQHNRPLFRIKLEPLGGGYVWCAEPRTLVILLRPDAAKIEDMDRIPGVPRKGADGLPSGLRELLEKRLQRSVLWAAGDVQNASFVNTLADFTSLPSNETALLKGLRSFAMGLLVQEDLTMVGALKASDHKHAVAWKDYLDKLRWPEVKDKKIIGPPKEGPASTWVNVQVRAEPAAVRTLLGRPLPAGK